MLGDILTLLTGAGGGVMSSIAITYLKTQKNEESLGELKVQVKEIDTKINDLSLQVAKEYLTKSEVTVMHTDLNNKLDRVIEELGKINVSLATKVDR